MFFVPRNNLSQYPTGGATSNKAATIWCYTMDSTTRWEECKPQTPPSGALTGTKRCWRRMQSTREPCKHMTGAANPCDTGHINIPNDGPLCAINTNYTNCGSPLRTIPGGARSNMECAHKCFGKGVFFSFHKDGSKKCQCFADWKCSKASGNFDAGKACDLAAKTAGKGGVKSVLEKPPPPMITPVEQKQMPSAAACLELCETSKICEWVEFVEDVKMCSLYLEEDCEDHVMFLKVDDCSPPGK